MEISQFNSRFYRLKYDDVKIFCRKRPFYAVHHYLSYGKNEGRETRKLHIPFVKFPLLASYITSTDAYFSGVRLKINNERVFESIDIYLIETSSLKIKRKVSLKYEQFCPDIDRNQTFNFKPIPDSHNKKYLLFVIKKNYFRSNTLLEHILVETFCSNPISKLKIPSAILLSPVTACNLNCPHCLSQHSRKQVRELSDANWDHIASLVGINGIQNISSDYSGDIFFSQQRYKPWLDKIISTNAFLRFDTHANNLDTDSIDKIMRTNIQSINFSIDSMDPELYKRTRKGSIPLSNVLENISNFMKVKNSLRPDIKTCISLALMKSNLVSIEKALEFAFHEKINWVQGNHLMVYNKSVIEESAILDMENYSKYYLSAHARAKELGVVLAMPAPFYSKAHRTGHTPCSVPWNSCVILGNADVMPCCVSREIIGNLNENKLEEIFNGSKMQNFRSRVNSDKQPEACSKCVFYRFDNNFDSYVPGLTKIDREVFVKRVLQQPWFSKTA